VIFNKCRAILFVRCWMLLTNALYSLVYRSLFYSLVGVLIILFASWSALFQFASWQLVKKDYSMKTQSSYNKYKQLIKISSRLTSPKLRTVGYLFEDNTYLRTVLILFEDNTYLRTIGTYTSVIFTTRPIQFS